MKTRILYIGLVLAAVALGALAGSSLLAPAGLAIQPEGGKEGIVAPVRDANQPQGGKGRIAAPEPAHDILPREIKLRHALKGGLRVIGDGRNGFVVPGPAVVFTADGKTLAVAQNDDAGKDFNNHLDGTLKLWDVATGKERASFPLKTGLVMSFAFSADGKTLATVYGRNRTADSPQRDGPGSRESALVKLWDVASGKERPFVHDVTFDVASFSTDNQEIYASAVFSPDGKTLALAGELNDRVKAVQLWDVATGKVRTRLKGRLERAAFTPDGKILASVGGGMRGPRDVSKPTLWDVSDGRLQDAFSEGAYTSLVITPDSKMLATIGWDVHAVIKLWDVASGQQLASMTAHRGAGPSPTLAITADGRTIASAGEYSDEQAKKELGQVKLWDMATRRVWATLNGISRPPVSMVFAPDGKTLATVGYQEIKLWDIPERAEHEVPANQLKAQVASARKVYELNLMAFKVGVAKSNDLESLYLWSVRWLNAERDLSDTPADRVAAAAAHLERMKTVEAMANAFAKIEPAGGRHATAADFYRAQAQVWQSQANGK
jgi:WD40 repeat protein